MYKKIILGLVCYIAQVSFVLGQKTISLDESMHYIDVAPFATVLEDTSNQLVFQDILNKKNLKFSRKKLNFGFSASTFWLKMQVKEVSSNKDFIAYNPHQWFLNIDYAPLDSITLYYLSTEGNWQSHILGDGIPFKNRLVPFRTSTIPLNLYKERKHVFYLKIKTKGSVQIPVSIQSTMYFQRMVILSEILYGFMYGSLLIIMFYNSFLYLVTRDISYLYYCLFILFFVLAEISLHGHFLYLWGDYIYFSNTVLPFSLSFSSLWIILFSIRFLNTARLLPRWHLFLKLCVGISLFFTFLSLKIDYNKSIVLSSLLVAFLMILLWWLGITAWIKGNKVARLYIIAWSVVLIGVLLVALKSYGVIHGHYINYIPKVGSIAQVLLLSLALAERIRFYRKEKNAAQEKTLMMVQENERLIKEQNEILEQKVIERTEELEVQQERLQEQSKLIEERNLLLEQKNHQIKSSINAALIIQQAILPQPEETLKLLQNYFVIYRPKDIVSGDFYWVDQVDDLKILVVADCTGHGVPGAFMTLIGNRVLDKIIHLEKIVDCASILQRLHEEIYQVLRQDRTDNNNGMDVSLVVMREEDSNVFISFAGAKNDMYYIHGEESEIREIKGTRKSIGGLQSKTKQFENKNLLLPKGSLIYLGSDGFEDQNDIDRKRLGKTRMKELLSTLYHLPLEKQQQNLEEYLDEYMQGTTQRDDILWMGIRL